MRANERMIVAGSLLAALAVALGAFAAHGLEERLRPALLAAFETGVRYHLYHALAIMIAALIGRRATESWWPGAAVWSFGGGIVLFSGSLYALALTDIRAFALVTPVGGLLLLAGWILLAVGAWRSR